MTDSKADALEQRIAVGDPIIILFKLPNCPPCDALAAAIRDSAEERLSLPVFTSELVAGDVATRSLHLRFGVRAYPTVVILAAGACIWRDEGRLAEGDRVELASLEIAAQACMR